MRSDLIITRIPEHSEAWYQFRKNGIGGSEVGNLLLPNPDYDSAIWIFHEKIGTIESRKNDNESMFWGRELEDQIADKWRYWDGTTDGYIQNYKDKKIIRECRSVNGYVVNPKYPWLFASLDRVMNISGGRNLLTGNPLTTEAVLECKAMNQWVAQKWEDGMPIYYLMQIHQYMAIIESDYAEIVVLENGNKLRVEKIQRDDGLCEKIINITKGFWYNRVLPAKEAFAKRQEAEKSGNINEVEKQDAIIQRLEPDPDKTKSYQEFLNKKYLQERETIEGNMEMFDLCKKDKVLLGVKNLIDDERTGIANVLIKALTLNGAEAIDFGRLGSYSWSERKGSKNRVPSNKIKEKPTEDQLLEEFQKINLECY
jgi:putative phage-type endonuclease